MEAIHGFCLLMNELAFTAALVGLVAGPSILSRQPCT